MALCRGSNFASSKKTTTMSLFFIVYLLVTPSQSLDFDFHKHRKVKGPIKTLVVVVMENRSFDHVLGWLKSARPGINGLTGKESNRVDASDPNSPEVFVSDEAVFVDADPGHSFQAIREEIFGSENCSADPAPMNGFAQFLICVCAVTLPEVKTSLRPRGPKEDEKLSEFQVEMIQLASQLNGDYVLNTYPHLGHTMTVGEANAYAEDAVRRFLEAGKAALKAGANESVIVTMRPSLTSRTVGRYTNRYVKDT
ncbi:hypothetical protein QQ045_016467 [Rhodiola kirilowii]